MTVADVSQTTRIETEEHFHQSTSFLTILLAEIVGPAILLENLEASAIAITRSQDDVTLSVIKRHNGKMIKALAGSVMAEFSEPSSAVWAAVEIERLLQESNLTLAHGKHLEVRIGIHAYTGPRQGIEVFSDVVNVAARITKTAAPMQILISRAVYETVSTESNLHCQWLRHVTIDTQTKEEAFEVSWVETPSNIPSRYEVLCQVGTGGMGIVYKVRDTETSEIIALKILKPGIASDALMQENLKREVCLARKVTHKNVCRIHEFNRSNGAACISMEFIAGESLQSKMRHVGPLAVNEVLEITQQICAGLHEAHLQGIVHRDLKPANIMLDRSGSVKIMDFGIARSFQDNSQLTGTITGTPAYMAPEQLELKPVGAYTDVYALGLLLYEMVTGSTAFAGETPVAIALKQIREFPKRPREVLPNLPAHMEAAILKCLQKDPAKRFQSVDELDLALRKTTKASTVVSWWNSFTSELRRTTHEIGRNVNSALRDIEVRARKELPKVIAYLRQMDWQVIKRVRKEQALALLGLVVLLGGLLVFSLGSSHTHRTDVSTSAKSSVILSQSSPHELEKSAPGELNRAHPQTVSSDSDELNPTLTTKKIDLGRDSDRVLEETPSSGVGSPKHIPESAVAPRETKAPSRSQRSTTTTPGANSTQRKNQLSSVPSVNSQQPATPLASAEPTNEPRIPNREPESSVSGPVVAAAVPTSTAISATDAPKKTEVKPDFSTYYLDTGSFKDPKQADNAVAKLTQLGFHAVAIHKSILWNQSYHIQVGPYTSPKDIESAQQSLATEGYKTHVVK